MSLVQVEEPLSYGRGKNGIEDIKTSLAVSQVVFSLLFNRVSPPKYDTVNLQRRFKS